MPQVETPPPPRRSRRRMFIVATLAILLVLAALAVGRTVIRSNYYVADYSGTVSIMQGIQGSVLGVPLHEPYSRLPQRRNQLSVIRYGQAGSHPRLPTDEAVRTCAESATCARCRPGFPLAPWTKPTRSCGNWPPSPCCRLPAARAPRRRLASTDPDDPRRHPSAERHGTDARYQRAIDSRIPRAPEAPSPATPVADARRPTVTALSPPPPQPGIDCRAVE